MPADFFSDIALAASVPNDPGPQQALTDTAKDGQSKMWTYTNVAQGADPQTIGLFLLRASEVVDTHQFSMIFSALGVARVIAIGHEAFTDANGVVTAENLTALGSAIDAATAARVVLADAPTGGISSFGPLPVDVMIFATISGGTFDAAETLDGSAVVGRAS